jgi:parallel beta-helix repeat protein
MHKNLLIVVGITTLFLGTCITPTVAVDNIKKSSIPISSGNTLYVGGTGEGNYTKIQDAIDNASDGDTVFVYNGTYYENLYIEKTIDLIGENKNKTFIDGGGKGRVIDIDFRWVTINGFTISNGSAGIITCSDNLISNNIIKMNSNLGIGITAEHRTIVTDNIITMNDVGIEIYYYGQNNIIENNNIINNTKYGIFLSHTGYTEVKDNNISNNGCGLCIYESMSTVINNSFFKNKGNGIVIRLSQKDIISNNNFIENEENGLYISFSEEDNISYNNFVKNRKNGISITVSKEITICKNNFINNRRDAFFMNPIRYSFRTHWKYNYWGNPLEKPKIIFGRAGLIKLVPWVNFDWHPVKEPYDIDV